MDDGPDEAVYDCCAAKRVHKRGSPLRLTDACSADLRAGTDCVEKRELHRDVLFNETKYRDTLRLTNWPDQRSGRSRCRFGLSIL